MHHSNQDYRKKYLSKSLFIRDVKTQAIRDESRLFMEKENPELRVSKAITAIKYETAPFMPAIHSA